MAAITKMPPTYLRGTSAAARTCSLATKGTQEMKGEILTSESDEPCVCCLMAIELARMAERSRTRQSQMFTQSCLLVDFYSSHNLQFFIIEMARWHDGTFTVYCLAEVE